MDDKDKESGTGVISLDEARQANVDKNGVAKIEVDAEGFVGRDLVIKATKKPPRTATITFPPYTDWAGAKVRIKEIRGGEKGRIDSSMIKGKAGDNRIDSTETDAHLIIAASINADGSQMFHTKNDLATVQALPASVMEFWVAEIRKLFQKPDKDEAEDGSGNSTSTASRG